MGLEQKPMTDRTPEAALALNRVERDRDLTDAEMSAYFANRQTAIRHGTADIGTEIAEQLRDRLAAYPGAWHGWMPPWVRVLTPVTPEVPPPGLREALLTAEPIIRGMMDALAARMPFFHALLDEHPDRFVPALVDAALAATRTPEPPDSDPVSLIELPEGACGVMRLCERPQGHDGPHQTSVDRAIENVRAEPPDSGDGATLDMIRLGWKRGRPNDYSEDRARWMARAIPVLIDLARSRRDAGIDAQLLTDAINTVWRQQPGLQYGGFVYAETSAAVIREYARLRSGSPAPDGGE